MCALVINFMDTWAGTYQIIKSSPVFYPSYHSNTMQAGMVISFGPVDPRWRERKISNITTETSESLPFFGCSSSYSVVCYLTLSAS